MKQAKQQPRLSLGLLLLFTSYALSLCTLNPRVHADTLQQAAQVFHTTEGHCSRPSQTSQAATPLPSGSQRTTEPWCCELRGGANRTIPVSPVQIDIPPLLLLTLVPLDADELVKKVQLLPILQAPHSSHSPPLYLANATLLI